MSLSVDKIEALAPDQASLTAAVKIKQSSWPMLATSVDNTFVWGECQGSGSTPYRTCLHMPDLGYKCSCPSRKFPCKHALSLMLVLAKAPQAFTTGDIPDWVSDWAGRRKSGTPKPVGEPRSAASLDEAVSDAAPDVRDEKAEARAAAQRERLKEQREELILKGLDELDLWIGDHLARGLAGFMAQATQSCRTLAQRLVDAKAPGLASAIDGLPAHLLALPEPLRHGALIESLGDLHLLAAAYRRQQDLPAPLRHDVRRIAGWTMERQALLDTPDALRIAGTWLVTGTIVEIQPDRLRRIETWLVACGGDQPVNAVLIDYVPVAAGAGGSAFLAGEKIEAELVFYPSAVPLRAMIARHGTTSSGTVDDVIVSETLSQATRAYSERRAVLPWLGQWQMTLSGVSCVDFDGQGLWISDGRDGLPLRPASRDEALVLSGVELSSVTGLWDGRYFLPMIANTSLGRWTRP